MKKEMKAHERFRAVANGLPVDRLPMIEWACWWDKTIDSWDKGHPELKLKQMGTCGLHRHLGLDINLQHVIRPVTSATPPPKHDGGPVITSIGEYQKIKHTLYPRPVLDADFVAYAKQLHETGTGIVWFSFDGFFWFPRVLFGIENHLYSFYDEPELYHIICEDLLKWQKDVVEVFANAFPFDFMTFFEDMSYNNGSMLSKEHFHSFITPYYKEIIPLIRSAGILTIVDSDGDITEAVDWFSEAGVEGMLPLERQAGVEINLYQQKHPDMLFIGHFDKMVMHKGESAIRQEFERLLPAMKKGRFIPSVDHQTPPAVAYEDYLIYMKLFREYAAIE